MLALNARRYGYVSPLVGLLGRNYYLPLKHIPFSTKDLQIWICLDVEEQ